MRALVVVETGDARVRPEVRGAVDLAEHAPRRRYPELITADHWDRGWPEAPANWRFKLQRRRPAYAGTAPAPGRSPERECGLPDHRPAGDRLRGGRGPGPHGRADHRRTEAGARSVGEHVCGGGRLTPAQPDAAGCSAVRAAGKDPATQDADAGAAHGAWRHTRGCRPTGARGARARPGVAARNAGHRPRVHGVPRRRAGPGRSPETRQPASSAAPANRGIDASGSPQARRLLVEAAKEAEGIAG